jgi:hypothetical protein
VVTLVKHLGLFALLLAPIFARFRRRSAD